MTRDYEAVIQAKNREIQELTREMEEVNRERDRDKELVKRIGRLVTDNDSVIINKDRHIESL